MADPELDKIRQQRLAQLQAQHGVSVNNRLRLCFFSIPPNLHIFLKKNIKSLRILTIKRQPDVT